MAPPHRWPGRASPTPLPAAPPSPPASCGPATVQVAFECRNPALKRLLDSMRRSGGADLVGAGVGGGAVDADFEVHVGAGAVAGGALVADDLALADVLALAHGH